MELRRGIVQMVPGAMKTRRVSFFFFVVYYLHSSIILSHSVTNARSKSLSRGNWIECHPSRNCSHWDFGQSVKWTLEGVWQQDLERPSGGRCRR